MKLSSKRFGFLIFFLMIACFTLYALSGVILGGLGNFLIRDEMPVKSEAIVVLNTGVEYYSRLIEATKLYNNGYADMIIINGNRKMDIQRELEAKGYAPCCEWFENWLRILSLYNIPRNKVVYISAEDVYDTVGEAEIVGDFINKMGIRKIIIITSKYHSRRANYIWKKLYAGDFIITTVSAKTDPFNPKAWWHDGRQIRWLLAEYGAWIYYFWKRIKDN